MARGAAALTGSLTMPSTTVDSLHRGLPADSRPWQVGESAGAFYLETMIVGCGSIRAAVLLECMADNIGIDNRSRTSLARLCDNTTLPLPGLRMRKRRAGVFSSERRPPLVYTSGSAGVCCFSLTFLADAARCFPTVNGA